jgi:hypothetical protein
LKSVFDKIPVFVYIIEPISDKPCETCYIQAVIEGSSEPYIREYHNVELDKYFLVVSRKVSWLEGRTGEIKVRIIIRLHIEVM